MTILFATNNEHKFKEIKEILPGNITLLTLADTGISDDVAETGETLEENALIKARTIFSKAGIPTFADDTGLEVESLGGAPGVKSARFAGEAKDMEKNIAKLLEMLHGENNRRARFRTVIALVDGKSDYLFDGIAEGRIISEKRGEKGFGYDPVFMPEGYDITFAEMPLSLKNEMSHRAVAFRKLAAFLSPSGETQ